MVGLSGSRILVRALRVDRSESRRAGGLRKKELELTNVKKRSGSLQGSRRHGIKRMRISKWNRRNANGIVCRNVSFLSPSLTMQLSGLLNWGGGVVQEKGRIQ